MKRALTTFLSLHRSVLVLRCRVASFTAVELRARKTGLYWFSNLRQCTVELIPNITLTIKLYFVLYLSVVRAIIGLCSRRAISVLALLNQYSPVPRARSSTAAQAQTYAGLGSARIASLSAIELHAQQGYILLATLLQLSIMTRAKGVRYNCSYLSLASEACLITVKTRFKAVV